MPSTNNLVYFISGGNRGIGFALVSKLSERPNTTVVTTARNPESATELQQLIETHPNVHVIEYDAESRDLSHVSTEVNRIVGDGIDIFIANAGIENGQFPVLEEKADIWIDHYTVNVLGPILLTQALYPFLVKKNTRKIVYISTAKASMGQFLELSGSAYSQSKAALNYTAKELSFELRDEKFTVVPIHPGMVESDMGNGFLKRYAIEHPEAVENLLKIAISVDQSASYILDLVANLTPEKNGKFLNYDGAERVY